jgi:hypothetical protein
VVSVSDDNPFLIPPPPPGIAPTPKSEPEKVAQPVRTEDLISLPPGIVDSGTYRVSAPRAPRPEPEDDAPLFVPVAAPGMPPTLPTATVDDATRANVGRRSAPAWRLTLPGGEQLLLEKTTLVGRDPANNAEWPSALLLPIIDPGKTISKTHAVLELTDSAQLIVHDLDSTNGVYLGYSGADDEPVEPGAPALVEHGATLSFGEYTVTVERS